MRRKDYPHGTRGRALSCWQRCDCELCAEALRAWRKDYNRRYRERRGNGPPLKGARQLERRQRTRRVRDRARYACPHCGYRARHEQGHDGREGRPCCPAAARSEERAA